MNPFLSVEGTILSIQPMQTSAARASGCTLLISVRNLDGQSITNLVVAPSTYVLDQSRLRIGDRITAFYDSSAPVPLIFPPQFRAVAIARTGGRNHAVMDFFDQNLVSSDGQLRLTPSNNTRTMLTNGQIFSGNIANRYLLVLYSVSTRSMPAITTPEQIVVFCSQSE